MNLKTTAIPFGLLTIGEVFYDKKTGMRYIKLKKHNCRNAFCICTDEIISFNPMDVVYKIKGD